MPEVREILDTHLDPARDPSLAIRAVYGQWFPWIALLDAEWAKSRVAKIFPTDEVLQPLRNAAWDTYVIFCPPYDNVFELLQDEYARAVEAVGSPRTEQRQLADPDEKLGEHLMTYYWRGKLRFDQPGPLLEKFFAKASDELRAHALDFIGRSLRITESPVEALTQGLQRDDIIALRAGVRLPFYGQARRGRVDAVDHLRRAAIASEADSQRQARSQVEELADLLPLQRQRLEIVRDLVSVQAEEAMEAARAGYISGRMTALDLLHAAHRLFDARLDAVDAQYVWLVSRARLEGALGVPLTAMETAQECQS